MSIMELLSGAQKNQLGYEFNASKTSQVFAGELSRRISQSAAAKGETGAADAAGLSEQAQQTEQALAEKQAQLQKLESSIQSAVDYVTEKHGEKAGTAMMGIMLKRLGENEITEESLGNAFLDVIRFTDKNFGIEAGDGLMAHLNGNLNDSLNEFFDNGLSEQFIAVTSGQTNAAQTLNSGQSSQKLAEQYTDAVMKIIKEGRDANTADNAYAVPADKNSLLGVLYDEQI